MKLQKLKSTKIGHASIIGDSSLMLALEPRLMFDAAMVATALHDVTDSVGIVEAQHDPMADHNLAAIQALFTAPPAVASPTPQPMEILFVDSRVSDYQPLLNGVNRPMEPMEVVILDPNQNGMAQITANLANRQEVSAIHILSHGNAGSLQLGSDYLAAANLNQYGEALRTWGRALTESGDILIYGCNVANGPTGDGFIHNISRLTGADVAASTDLTGGTRTGGNWTLEDHTGSIEATSPFATRVADNYQHLLDDIRGTPHLMAITVNSMDVDINASIDANGNPLPPPNVARNSELTLVFAGQDPLLPVSVVNTGIGNIRFYDLNTNALVASVATNQTFPDPIHQNVLIQSIPGLVEGHDYYINIDKGAYQDVSTGLDSQALTDNSYSFHVGVNSAPSLNLASPFALPAINRSDTNNDGFRVGSLLESYSDPNVTTTRGIAIDSVSVGPAQSPWGHWEYRLHNELRQNNDWGLLFDTNGAISTASALTLDSNDRIRFVPHPDAITTSDHPSFTFRAWDETTGTDGGRLDVTTRTTSGSVEISTLSHTASLTVHTDNAAPTISNLSISGYKNVPIGFAEQQFMNRFTDTNPDGLSYFQITQMPSQGRLWLYNETTGILNVVTPNTSFLGHQLNHLFYQSKQDYASTDSFSWRASDGIAWSNSAEVNVTLNPSLIDLNLRVDPVISTPYGGNPQVAPNTGFRIHFNQPILPNTGYVHFFDTQDNTEAASVQVVNPGNAHFRTEPETHEFYIDGVSGLLAGQTYYITIDPNTFFSPITGYPFLGLIENSATENHSLSFTITESNFPPFLDNPITTLPAVNFSDTKNNGFEVESIIGSSFQDLDATTTKGLLITAASPGNATGYWQYALTSTLETIPADLNWINIGNVSSTRGLALDAHDRIRFVPTGTTPYDSSAPSLTICAWDKSDGITVGSYITMSANPPTTASYETTSHTANLTVHSGNSPQVMNDYIDGGIEAYSNFPRSMATELRTQFNGWDGHGDADRDQLNSFQITQGPDHGTLFFVDAANNHQPLQLNTTYPDWMLSFLTYQSNTAFSGNDSFTWRGSDRSDGVSFSNQAKANILVHGYTSFINTGTTTPDNPINTGTTTPDNPIYMAPLVTDHSGHFVTPPPPPIFFSIDRIAHGLSPWRLGNEREPGEDGILGRHLSDGKYSDKNTKELLLGVANPFALGVTLAPGVPGPPAVGPEGGPAGEGAPGANPQGNGEAGNQGPGGLSEQVARAANRPLAEQIELRNTLQEVQRLLACN